MERAPTSTPAHLSSAPPGASVLAAGARGGATTAHTQVATAPEIGDRTLLCGGHHREVLPREKAAVDVEDAMTQSGCTASGSRVRLNA
ncbi:hypothetical protein MRX96_029113 [Rhipicephalus microplus]